MLSAGYTAGFFCVISQGGGISNTVGMFPASKGGG